jgi:hypothetical protein
MGPVEGVGRQVVGRLLVFAAVVSLLPPLLSAMDGWPSRFSAAGFLGKPDGSYVWDRAPANLLLIPGLPGRRPASFAVTVGSQKASSREHLDLTTPEMIKLAIGTLRGPQASLAFEYVTQGAEVKPTALREAMSHWAETATWSSIGEESRPEALKPVKGWFIVGARTYTSGTYVTVGVLHPLP